MYLPHHNARLTQILEAGSSEDHDQPATPGARKWSGDAEAFVDEELIENTASGELDRLKRTTFTIPKNVPATIEAEDYVTYTQNGSTFTRRVRDTKRDDFLGTIKLTLWDE